MANTNRTLTTWVSGTAAILCLLCFATLVFGIGHTFAQSKTTGDEVEVPASTDINGIFIAPDGNVGVGTNAPTSDLHVRGNVMTEGRLSGAGYQGRYVGAPVFSAANTLGKPAAFVFIYDQLNYGNSPQAIQILNADANVYKTFVIDHPVASDRYLVHATLEGPEGAVFYRGSARLKNGEAVVHLPGYFEALTKEYGRTIQLTNINGFDKLAVQLIDGRRIVDGTFKVASNNQSSVQQFDWEVKAVRSDKPALEVQPMKSEFSVSGFGPYKVGMKRSSYE